MAAAVHGVQQLTALVECNNLHRDYEHAIHGICYLGLWVDLVLIQYKDCLTSKKHSYYKDEIDGLVQERRNSSALAMELRLPCTNPRKE